MRRVSIVILLLFLSVNVFANITNIVPNSRKLDWSTCGSKFRNSSQVEYAKIFDVTNYANCVDTTYGGNSQQILAAVRAANLFIQKNPAKYAIVYLPAGKYYFIGNEAITLGNHILLKGAGADCTEITSDSPNSPNTGTPLVQILGTVDGTHYNITSGVTKGSKQITIENAACGNLNVGDFIRVCDNKTIKDANGNDSPIKRGQIFQILSKNADKIELNSEIALHYDCQPFFYKVTPVTGTGIEDIKFSRKNSESYISSNTVEFTNAAHCWMYGVELVQSEHWHVKLNTSSNISITGCSIHHHNSNREGKGYGIELEASSNCLIENNILNSLRHAVCSQYGSVKNVIAYNYSYESWGYESWSPLLKMSVDMEIPTSDFSVHGGEAAANLFEHNVGVFGWADNTHGQNGAYNTYFLNAFFEPSEVKGDFRGGALYIDNSDSAAIIGNKVESGMGGLSIADHGTNTFNCYNSTNDWQTENVFGTDPSLYLPQKPDWLNNYNLLFVASNPARTRKENNQKFTLTGPALPRELRVSITKQFEFDSDETTNQDTISNLPIVVKTPNSITKNTRTYFFAGWSDGHSDSSRTVDSNLSVAAIYKIAKMSNCAHSLFGGNQRKIAKVFRLNSIHWVYESMNRIWYTSSTDNGLTWSRDRCISGLGIANSPCISCENDEDVYDVYVVWQEKKGSNTELYFKDVNQNTVSTLIDTDYLTDMQPVVATEGDRVLVIYKKKISSSTAQLCFKYSTDAGKTFTGRPVSPINVGDLYADSYSVAWNPTIKKFMVSTVRSNSSLSIDLFSFDGIMWKSEGNVYSSTQLPTATPYSQLAVDGTGRTHVTWIGYDNYYGNNSAAMYRSFLNGRWSAVQIFRDDALYEDPIVYTTVSGHHDSNGGASILYTSAKEGEAQTLFDLYSSDSTGLSHLKYMGTSAPIEYPSLAEKSDPLSIPFIFSKGKASPYSLVCKFRNDSPQATNNPSMLKALPDDSGEKMEDGSLKYYRRIEITDTVKNEMLGVQFGDVTEKNTAANSAVSLVKFLSGSPIKLIKNDSLSVKIGLKNKNWKGKASIVFDLVNSKSGALITKIGEYNLSTINQASTFEEKAYSIANLRNESDACLKVSIDCDNSKNLVVTYADILSLNYASPKIGKTADKPLQVAEMPKEYGMSQNYPNPFNPTTVIQYQIPKAGLVTLKVYDILGREVAQLVNDFKNEGHYVTDFDGSKLSSGTYIYELRVNDYLAVKKMILVK